MYTFAFLDLVPPAIIVTGEIPNPLAIPETVAPVARDLHGAATIRREATGVTMVNKRWRLTAVLWGHIQWNQIISISYRDYSIGIINIGTTQVIYLAIQLIYQ